MSQAAYSLRAERTPLGDGSREPQGKGLEAYFMPLASHNPCRIPRLVESSRRISIVRPLMAY